ncbi:hypothetical protein EDEG_02703 [Edhazardia aedis USNM 41457]|uniref:Uncharacterized protein n=1 Tax=Edhazardia aedis (strain USNM 41457) TaxID=1003232 RepID=J9D523_EDHAE|nr:hypothetical protein EDEG_02703 [Edhazardia aedis USNM 41457]|eukprot:EJW02911.1 hypothetical protein EDEG_02703 [Edhazardia aedis USNM 41457]
MLIFLLITYIVSSTDSESVISRIKKIDNEIKHHENMIELNLREISYLKNQVCSSAYLEYNQNKIEADIYDLQTEKIRILNNNGENRYSKTEKMKFQMMHEIEMKIEIKKKELYMQEKLINDIKNDIVDLEKENDTHKKQILILKSDKDNFRNVWVQ